MIPYQDPGILKSLRERTEYTPDFHKLRLKKRIPVFVYGTLKKGRPNHVFLSDVEYYGKGYTVMEDFQMRRTVSFPVVFRDKRKDVVTGVIRGEVYGVGIEHLHCLDRLESNGQMYKRQEEFICLEDQEISEGRRFRGNSIQKCWMYLGIPEFWDHRHLNLQYTGKFNYHVNKTLEGKTFFMW